MVLPTEPGDRGNDDPTGSNDGTDDRAGGRLDRRSYLKLASAISVAGAIGADSAIDAAGATPAVTQEDDYEVWTVTSPQVYDLSDGEVLENVLVDQTHPDGSLTIRARDKAGWEVRNVGFMGVGKVGGGSTAFQFLVSAPSGGTGLIENVWASAKSSERDCELGGIGVRGSHAGHMDIRHTYIEGYGNNAVYASGVGKDGGNDGSVTLENCYHRDNTVSQFRIGSPDSVVRNCIGIVNDPEGLRGTYPNSSDKNARCVWGKHFPDQRVENSAFYVSPDDVDLDAAFEARYIQDRSHGSYAETRVADCDLNADAPRLKESTSNAEVNISGLGENPTADVISGGVPTSPEMAASGGREMPDPPELSSSDGSSGDSTTDLNRSLVVDGRDAGWTDYEFTVSEEIANDPDVGTFNDTDVIDGSTVTGFVNGGVDGYRFSGEITKAVVDGDATILVDGQPVDPDTLGSDTEPVVALAEPTDLTDSSVTLHGLLDDLGGAAAADVRFEYREAGADTWTATSGQRLDSTGSFQEPVDGLAADTDYEYRAVADASDGDTATSAVASLTTASESTDSALDRSLVVDGRDADWTDYEFTVSGEIENDPDVGTFGDGDSADGDTATGFVNGGVDGYRFSGEITKAVVDGDATILVDGQPVDPADLGSEPDLPNKLVIDGRGTSGETTYDFAVTGELENDPEIGATESGDELADGSATGTVTDDRDGYRFSGDLRRLVVDGNADIEFEDNDG